MFLALPMTARGCAKVAVLLASLIGFNTTAQAQIRIGQTAAFSGSGSVNVEENTDGAGLYFDAVNAQGGIKGQPIEPISMDDSYESRLSAEHTKSLIEPGVLAMFLSRGTAQSQAQLLLLAEHRLALVATSSGAMVLHQQVNPCVFSLRASFQREAERAVKHLANQSGLEFTGVSVIGPDGKFWR